MPLLNPTSDAPAPITAVLQDRISLHVTPAQLEQAKLLKRANELTRKLTAFEFFEDLLRGSHNGDITTYRPSFMKRNAEFIELADLYDRAQEARGDARRASRGW